VFFTETQCRNALTDTQIHARLCKRTEQADTQRFISSLLLQ